MDEHLHLSWEVASVTLLFKFFRILLIEVWAVVVGSGFDALAKALLCSQEAVCTPFQYACSVPFPVWIHTFLHFCLLPVKVKLRSHPSASANL